MRTLRFFTLLTALASLGFSQSAGKRAAFDLAVIHRATGERYPVMSAGFRGGRLEIKSATVLDLIANAYGIPSEKVVGGPGWLELDRFDVIAKVPANATPQTIRPMLQSLLADRFGLAIHNDQRPMPAYVLSVGAGKPRMTQSDDSAGTACQRQPQSDERVPIPLTCRAITMAAFARQLQTMAGDYLASPVVDATNLEGSWDLNLKWTSRDRLVTAGSDEITIFDALDRQLGLKLQLKEAPTPVIVVDSVNRKPTLNLPEAESGLPPSPPPAFEVATIKMTDPQFQGIKVQTPPNGQVSIQGVTLSYLIQTMWFITPEMIAGAPQWLDTQRWDIVAKVSSTPGTAPQTDMDSMITMVRALVEDRFRMTTHMEERIVPAYTLTAVKPTMQKADPTNRTGCKEGPGADGKDPRVAKPALSRLVTCHNMTMAEFTAELPRIANARNPLNGVIRSTVLDSTRLDGAWDFVLNFSPELGTYANGVPAPTGDGPPDPNGKLSLSEAIARQLGLRLEVVKRPAQVLVIDHIESQPGDN